MTNAIVAEGLVKTYGDVTALDGLDLDGAGGHRAGPARPQRRRQDHHRAHPHHPARARRRAGRRSPGSTSSARPGELRRIIGLSGQYAAVDEYLTGFENLDMVGRLYHLGRGRSRERAHELLERFDLVEAGGPPGQELLRRHAAPARPRRRAGRRAAGAVPRRADHRARPAQPARHVGRHRRPGARRHDAAAHHAVPGGGRPARRPDRGHRPRPGDRRGHRRRAQGPGRRRAARGHLSDRGSGRRRARRCWPGSAAATPQVDRRRAPAHRCRSTAARRCWSRRSASWTPPASRSRTSGCAGRRSTTSSSA